MNIPHPFPYQGSKRNLAHKILPYIPLDANRIIEPFCGTASISIACSIRGIGSSFLLNDINKPLMDLWQEILYNPQNLAEKYSILWHEQQEDSKVYFKKIRDEFNRTNQPHYLIYLLARIVKGSIRYNNNGEFNQSADNRRLGMKPEVLKKNIEMISRMMKENTTLKSVDFTTILDQANGEDIIYLDPPYQGTSKRRDQRYLEGLLFEDFVQALESLNKRNMSFIVSYDGITGEKEYGEKLPSHLNLKHIYINAGKSTQSTLLGKSKNTYESLYISENLIDRLGSQQNNHFTYPQEELFVS